MRKGNLFFLESYPHSFTNYIQADFKHHCWDIEAVHFRIDKCDEKNPPPPFSLNTQGTALWLSFGLGSHIVESKIVSDW